MRRRQAHGRGLERFRCAEAHQRGAIGAQQEGGLDQVAPRLLDGQRREEAVVARPFRHDAIDREAHLLFDLRDGQFRQRRVAAPGLVQPGMRAR